MAGGVIGYGQSFRQQGLRGLSRVADLEQSRERANEQLETAEKQQQMSSIGTGAGMGMAIGAQYGSMGGPIGAGIGAVVGLLASDLF